MTRKQLEDLGLTKEQADSVMKINGDDIENAKGTTSTEIKNLQTEVEGLKTQVGDRDKQLETLKASAGDNADLKKKIEDLQTENATATYDMGRCLAEYAKRCLGCIPSSIAKNQ